METGGRFTRIYSNSARQGAIRAINLDVQAIPRRIQVQLETARLVSGDIVRAGDVGAHGFVGKIFAGGDLLHGGGVEDDVNVTQDLRHGGGVADVAEAKVRARRRGEWRCGELGAHLLLFFFVAGEHHYLRGALTAAAVRGE